MSGDKMTHTLTKLKSIRERIDTTLFIGDENQLRHKLDLLNLCQALETALEALETIRANPNTGIYHDGSSEAEAKQAIAKIEAIMKGDSKYNWVSTGPGGCDTHNIEHPCGYCLEGK